MNRLRFDVITIQFAPWQTLRERWARIEELGFDGAWLADHFIYPRGEMDHWFDGWALLSALALCTTRLRLGLLVASLVLRNPSLLALEALTVDHVSGGRLDLGIGAGGSARDFKMMGVQQINRAELISRYEEGVQVVDKLLREQALTFHGRHFAIEGAVLRPPPVQRPRPPMTLAAHGPRTLRLVARHAETWNAIVAREGGLDTEAFNRLNRKLDEACAAIGRPPADIGRSVLIWGEPGPFPSVDAFEQVVASYRDAGANHFILCWPFDRSEERVFERAAVEVIPRLRVR